VYYTRLVQQVLRLGEVLVILVLGVMNYYVQGTLLVRVRGLTCTLVIVPFT
jgi:hypothetical protein